jgi:hypothetical protein
MARIVADQLPPERPRCRQDVHHAVERRAGGLRQRKDKGVDGRLSATVHGNIDVGTNGSFLAKTTLMLRLFQP